MHVGKLCFIISSKLYGYSGFLHQLNWPPQYSWNIIVESGIKHYKIKPNQTIKAVKFLP